MKAPNPKSVYADKNFNLIVEFEDGEIRRVNVQKFIISNGSGAREVKTNINMFQKVFIEDGAAISWPCGVSLDHEDIYFGGEKIERLPATGNFSGVISKHYSE